MKNDSYNEEVFVPIAKVGLMLKHDEGVVLELVDKTSGVEAVIQVSARTAHDAIHGSSAPARDAARSRICSAFRDAAELSESGAVQLLSWPDIENSVETEVLVLHPSPSLLMPDPICGQTSLAC